MPAKLSRLQHVAASQPRTQGQPPAESRLQAHTWGSWLAKSHEPGCPGLSPGPCDPKTCTASADTDGQGNMGSVAGKCGREDGLSRMLLHLGFAGEPNFRV